MPPSNCPAPPMPTRRPSLKASGAGPFRVTILCGVANEYGEHLVRRRAPAVDRGSFIPDRTHSSNSRRHVGPMDVGLPLLALGSEAECAAAHTRGRRREEAEEEMKDGGPKLKSLQEEQHMGGPLGGAEQIEPAVETTTWRVKRAAPNRRTTISRMPKMERQSDAESLGVVQRRMSTVSRPHDMADELRVTPSRSFALHPSVPSRCLEGMTSTTPRFRRRQPCPQNSAPMARQRWRQPQSSWDDQMTQEATREGGECEPAAAALRPSRRGPAATGVLAQGP